jgi:hypothetical protein
MPIRKDLLSFWWFQNQKIGGMAQPGFNRLSGGHPEALTARESLLRNWIAKLPRERVPLSNLEQYLAWWGEVVVPFLDLPRDDFERDAEELLDRQGFESALARVNSKEGIVSNARWDDSGEQPHLEIQIDSARVGTELDILLQHGISVLVSMTENAPHPAVLASDLEIHHLPVEDTTPPTRDQAEAFARILDQADSHERRLVVHCMAGIGRTTTILVAGHLLRGRRLGEMIGAVAVANPDYLAQGSQWDFLQALAKELDLH